MKNLSFRILDTNQCYGSASHWCGSRFDLSSCCGGGFRFYLMRIRIQVTKMMQIRMRIRIHNTGTNLHFWREARPCCGAAQGPHREGPTSLDLSYHMRQYHHGQQSVGSAKEGKRVILIESLEKLSKVNRNELTQKIKTRNIFLLYCTAEKKTKNLTDAYYIHTQGYSCIIKKRICLLFLGVSDPA